MEGVDRSVFSLSAEGRALGRDRGEEPGKILLRLEDDLVRLDQRDEFFVHGGREGLPCAQSMGSLVVVVLLCPGAGQASIGVLDDEESYDRLAVQ